jgi:hypothetical protein
LLFVSFWSAIGRDWRMPLRMVQALVKERAALKRSLAAGIKVDVTRLP